MVKEELFGGCFTRDFVPCRVIILALTSFYSLSGVQTSKFAPSRPANCDPIPLCWQVMPYGASVKALFWEVIKLTVKVVLSAESVDHFG